MSMRDGTNHDRSFTALMSMAERDLGALMSVVTDLYGAEQAMISATDWIDELESVDAPPGITASAFRVITIATAARLARRLGQTAPLARKRGGTSSCITLLSSELLG